MTDARPAPAAVSPATRPVIIVMGVTGAGKTTIGQMLAQRLQMPFYDADDFHSPENLQKLADDIPLNDRDREPWLQVLAKGISQWSRDSGAVLACSALKHTYRSRFRHAAPDVRFVFLNGPPQLIAQRVRQRARSGTHVIQEFDLILENQYNDLQVPTDAIAVDVSPAPSVIVDTIIEHLSAHPTTKP